MNLKINKLKTVWEAAGVTTELTSLIHQFNFDKIINSLISVGPFYFYIIDFCDMSLSNVSPYISEIHGFNSETVTFDDILNTIHPDDMEFVSKAEATYFEFLYNKLGKENTLNYKANYSFRSRMKNGEYCMLNHQSIILTMDDDCRIGKSLNIHTNIDHLTKTNTNTISLIGLNNEPSYTNIDVVFDFKNITAFSKREIEIIKLISEGYTNKKIADFLVISEYTVKTHRKNINYKSGSKNSIELIRKCLLLGLI
ncbi:LuxR C-terminal-related transcriptional regulator [Flavobacterium sp. 5]|uniref:LuxR C-terminal-related transcriptional regulator n=1 Tax=Flavobacterium sp. 5 TaxID=2035199 RepID=UPI000C2B59AA|nr:LuxR C-terminal-related transcriptional regulator [Flavobacterium sp. 5]PKB16660.1 regulatory LuxR family protein [Flavobacterium sp. 5]